MGNKIYSFYSGVTNDISLDFYRKTSYVSELMLEKIYPEYVIIPMKQGFGAESIPVCSVGDKVEIGQCIAIAPKNQIGAHVHSGISGKVAGILNIKLPNGVNTKAIKIISDKKRTYHKSVVSRNNTNIDSKTVIGIIKNAGIVGMGGEGIPTYAKIKRAQKYKVSELLVNCLQSEPFATCDLYKVNEQSDYIVTGAVAIAGTIGVCKIRFLLSERRKTERSSLEAAIDRAKKQYADLEIEFEINLFKERCPQGYYRLVAKALYNAELEEDDILESACSAVLFNCSTLASCWEAIKDNLPMMQRVITVATDKGALHNVLVPIGTPISEIITSEVSKNMTSNKVLWGNALTGISVSDLENTPIIKTTPSITIIHNIEYRQLSCIHCGKCVDACPMNIDCAVVVKLIEKKMYEATLNEHVMNCILCGLCSYVCPSGIKITSIIDSFMINNKKNEEQEVICKNSGNAEVDKLEFSSVTLLEDFSEDDDTEQEDDVAVILPFEGGKKI